MTEIFIDPFIITTPTEGATKGEVELYLQNFTRWLEEALVAPHIWLYSAKAAARLMECSRYPTPQLLQRWTRIYEVDINTRQLSVWTSQILNEENDIEIRLEEHYLVELDETSISLEPEQFQKRWVPPITKDLLLLIAKLGACKHLGSKLVYGLFIATSALINVEKRLVVSTTILTSEPEVGPDIDCSCVQTFPLLYTPEDLPPPDDMVNLWDDGEKGVRYAINKYYSHYWKGLNVPPLVFSFCPSFFQTVTEKGIYTQELVLKKYMVAMAAVLTWNTHELHESYHLRPLRTGRTGDDPQVIRDDGAKAWRITVIPEGAGWRLHFWKKPSTNGDSIEFANVLKKHDPEEIY